MSMSVSPSDSPSLPTRPAPPSRSKHPHITSPSHPNGRNDGVMGGLRERTDEELRRTGREAIEEALREEWAVRDRLMEQVETIEDVRCKLEREKGEVEKLLTVFQARHEEAFRQQNRLEADLEARDELLDRLRGRLTEGERQTREVQKRIMEQERNFDAERQALQAQESHLQQRIRSLLAAKAVSPPAPRPNGPSCTELQEELASLNVSHSTLLAQLNTLSKDLHELRTANTSLREENEGWELLLRQRTLSGKVFEGGGLLSREMSSDQQPVPTHQSGPLEALNEETEMDELHSDLEAQSPIFEDDPMFVRDLDDQGKRMRPFSTSPDQGRLVPPRRRTRPKGESLGDVPVTGSGLDLAAELGRAEVNLDGSEMRVFEKGDEGEALRAEVKNLREANKALTLYCSKIIDRIIAQEGFEQILSVDYKTRRIGSGSASASSKANIRDLAKVMQGSPVAELEPIATEAERAGPVDRTHEVETKKARPLSLMVRAMSGSGVSPEKLVEGDPVKSVPETKSEKRSRRGFSLDFRSLGFGSSSPSPSDQKTSALKPLTLGVNPRSSTPIAHKISTSPQPSQARKLEPQAEDEEDKRERHRMEAAMKLMGIEKSSVEKKSYAPSSIYRTERKQTGSKSSSRSGNEPDLNGNARRTSGTLSGGQHQSRNGTPLSRLSSALGSNGSPFSPLAPQEQVDMVSPELVGAALKTFDEREAERAKALAQGKAWTGFTSPSPGSIRRASARRSMSGGDAGREQKIRESGSTSTLWSIGSGRPMNGEVKVHVRE